MSAFYDTGRNAFALGDIDWVADDIREIYVDSADYTLDLINDDFLDDIPAGARVSTTAMAGKSASAGVLDATDTVHSAVTGDVFEYIVQYKHTGTEGTSQLILLYDTATGLPATPNGGDITTEYDDGANKIAKL